MKKFVLLLVLVSALCCRMLAQGNDAFFFKSKTENTEYKLYDSYAKSDPDAKLETKSVPIGSGVVLLASLALGYLNCQRSESKKSRH